MCKHTNLEYDKKINTGDLSCGELTLSLFKYFKHLKKGAVVLVISKSKESFFEIPAWCKQTNKTLLKAEYPNYFIKK